MEESGGATAEERRALRRGPVRVAFDGRCRLVVAGDCGAGRAQLDQALRTVAEHRWTELTRWPGSYWIIAQAPDGTRFIAGDLAGLRPVFLNRTGTGPLWGSDLGHLVRLTGAPLDLGLLTARITHGEQHWPHRTPYRGIELVPGGSAVVVREGEVSTVDVTGIEPVADLRSGAEAFGSALTRAVQRPVREAAEEVGADLSGGLDSGTAVLLAAAIGPVRAVTCTDAHTSAEDTAYASRIAAYAGIEHHIASGSAEHLPFALTDVPPTGEPAAAAVNWDMDRLYRAPVAGSPLHLTGHGGDAVLDATTAAWVGMIQRGYVRDAKRHAYAWARLRGQAPGPYWRALRQTARTGRRESLLCAARVLETGTVGERPPGWTWVPTGQAAMWLTGSGRAVVAALLYEAADGPQPEFADEADQWTALRSTGAAARAELPLYEAIGLHPVHPYLDNQVVRAAFAVPAAERRGVDTFKPLLAAALPQLPPWLTGRRSKGSFTAQRIAGVARHYRALDRLITDSPLVQAGLLDSDAARRTLRATATGRGAAPIGELHHLLITCQWLATRPAAAQREPAC
ncbi:asparagine synthase-related protein [Streptomyces lichenis]|uniref:asparagine synthase (glutamine-hydrolyzing) n=1 Tax=Streptomyces lichenis TaxID=2306967 RepID=A0ABT0I4A4_9ACTN|nr:asparagine synthase-related protein [Streptomyces lichenis]MCK8676162.1 asparagine synthase-related protein [Streptomyces lichenis]